MNFSQRHGITSLPEALKPDAMPAALRNSLWNCFLEWLSVMRKKYETTDAEILTAIWKEYWKHPTDTMPTYPGPVGIVYKDAWNTVRDHFFGIQNYYDVYNFLDFLAEKYRFIKPSLGDAINQILSNELAAYRVINGLITPITDEQSIQSLEAALSDGGPFSSVNTHLAAALSLLSDRQHPDFRNSIKESISAVEAAAKVISRQEKAELGNALATLEKQGKLHGALKQAYSALYGYTSDADGIRHALMGESNLTLEDAKYFLLVCTAFINYLKTLV